MSAVTVVGIEQLPAAKALAPSLSLHPCGLTDLRTAGNKSQHGKRQAVSAQEEEDGRRSSSNEGGGKKTHREENSLFKPANNMQFRPGCDIRFSFSEAA